MLEASEFHAASDWHMVMMSWSVEAVCDRCLVRTSCVLALLLQALCSRALRLLCTHTHTHTHYGNEVLEGSLSSVNNHLLLHSFDLVFFIYSWIGIEMLSLSLLKLCVCVSVCRCVCISLCVCSYLCVSLCVCVSMSKMVAILQYHAGCETGSLFNKGQVIESLPLPVGWTRLITGRTERVMEGGMEGGMEGEIEKEREGEGGRGGGSEWGRDRAGQKETGRGGGREELAEGEGRLKK